MPDQVAARVSMWINSVPERVFDAFMQPEALTSFWLASAQAPLETGRKVHWAFLVKGAEVDTTATTVERPKLLAWDWSDGSRVTIELEPVDGGTAVNLTNDRLSGNDPVAAALDATEGFTIVLADLKTWLETGVSAGITRAKAKLIERRG